MHSYNRLYRVNMKHFQWQPIVYPACTNTAIHKRLLQKQIRNEAQVAGSLDCIFPAA